MRAPTLTQLLAAPDNRKRAESHPAAKLTWSKVRTARLAMERGAAVATVARLYGVSRQAMTKIRNWETWQE